MCANANYSVYDDRFESLKSYVYQAFLILTGAYGLISFKLILFFEQLGVYEYSMWPTILALLLCSLFIYGIFRFVLVDLIFAKFLLRIEDQLDELYSSIFTDSYFLTVGCFLSVSWFVTYRNTLHHFVSTGFVDVESVKIRPILFHTGWALLVILFLFVFLRRYCVRHAGYKPGLPKLHLSRDYIDRAGLFSDVLNWVPFFAIMSCLGILSWYNSKLFESFHLGNSVFFWLLTWHYGTASAVGLPVVINYFLAHLLAFDRNFERIADGGKLTTVTITEEVASSTIPGTSQQAPESTIFSISYFFVKWIRKSLKYRIFFILAGFYGYTSTIIMDSEKYGRSNRVVHRILTTTVYGPIVIDRFKICVWDVFSRMICIRLKKSFQHAHFYDKIFDSMYLVLVGFTGVMLKIHYPDQLHDVLCSVGVIVPGRSDTSILKSSLDEIFRKRNIEGYDTVMASIIVFWVSFVLEVFKLVFVFWIKYEPGLPQIYVRGYCNGLHRSDFRRKICADVLNWFPFIAILIALFILSWYNSAMLKSTGDFSYSTFHLILTWIFGIIFIVGFAAVSINYYFARMPGPASAGMNFQRLVSSPTFRRSFTQTSEMEMIERTPTTSTSQPGGNVAETSQDTSEQRDAAHSSYRKGKLTRLPSKEE